MYELKSHPPIVLYCLYDIHIHTKFFDIFPFTFCAIFRKKKEKLFYFFCASSQKKLYVLSARSTRILLLQVTLNVVQFKRIYTLPATLRSSRNLMMGIILLNWPPIYYNIQLYMQIQHNIYWKWRKTTRYIALCEPGK